MKKILLIILAFILLASSTSAFPWKLNATRDIDWSSYPVQVFTGTTGEDLEDYIVAHGAGTYLLKNKVTISEEFTIGDEYVCIVGGGSHGWIGMTTGTIFEVTMTSGRAINISSNYVTLDHVTVRFTNDSSTATAICINDFWAEIVSPSIYAAKGKAIEFTTNAFYYDISNPDIGMDPTGTAGTVFYFNGIGNGLIHGGIVANGAYGAFIKAGHPMFEFVYFYNQSTKGFYFEPTSANSAGDVWVHGCCIDFQGGNAVETSGAYSTENTQFLGCGFWNKATTSIFVLKNVKNWEIADSNGMKCENNTPILLMDDCDGIIISDNYISTTASGNNGIYVENDAGNKDITIIGNRLVNPGGTGIIISGASIGSYTVMGNRGTVTAGTPSSTKISEHNRDT